MPSFRLNCRDKILDLTQPKVMGILNVTPDSFSDGGKFIALTAAVDHARQMVMDGAAIIDIGGESTRPGAAPVSSQEELDRVIPVIQRLRQEFPIPISIDTSKPEVMSEALKTGASFINDVRALRLLGALQVVAKSNVPVCLMHMLAEPTLMQQAPQYVDVVSEIKQFLAERIQACLLAGIPREHILVDPGFGFGKTLSHNLTLLKHLTSFQELNVPIMVGISRKAMIEHLLGLSVSQREAASVALAVIAATQGARLIRAHDVKSTVEAITVASAVMNTQ